MHFLLETTEHLLLHLPYNELGCCLVCGVQIKQVIEKYINKCRADNYRAETIRDKKRHLGLLEKSTDLHAEQLGCEDLYRFLNTLNVTPVVEHKIRRDLRAFFKYLNEMRINQMPYTLIKNSPVAYQIRPRVLKEEYDKMLSFTENSRDRAILEFMWDTGVRIGEAVRIKLSDVDLKEKTFYVETEKTHKTRQGWFNCDLELYLKEYSPKTYLFEMSTKNIGVIFRKLKNKAGIKRAITPHSLRHAYASDLLEGGASLPDTALLCGHSKIQTTLVYYHSTNLKKAFLKRKQSRTK